MLLIRDRSTDEPSPPRVCFIVRTAMACGGAWIGMQSMWVVRMGTAFVVAAVWRGTDLLDAGRYKYLRR